jgi:hypothetical protein
MRFPLTAAITETITEIRRHHRGPDGRHRSYPRVVKRKHVGPRSWNGRYNAPSTAPVCDGDVVNGSSADDEDDLPAKTHYNIASDSIQQAIQADVINGDVIINNAGGFQTSRASKTWLVRGAIGLPIVVSVVVVAVVLSSTTQPSGAPANTPTSSSPASKSPSSSSTPTSSSVAPKGSIVTPTEKSVVKQTIIAQGAINDLPDGHQLYLFNYYDNCYFPQRANITGSSWSSKIEIGGAGDAGKTFTLILAEISPSGIAALNKYFDDQNDDQKKRGGEVYGIRGEQELANTYAPNVLFQVDIKREQPGTPSWY